jgi:hypothetical protein
MTVLSVRAPSPLPVHLTHVVPSTFSVFAGRCSVDGCNRLTRTLEDGCPAIYCEECLASAPDQCSGVIEGVLLGVIASFQAGLDRAASHSFPCCFNGCNILVAPTHEPDLACSEAHARGTVAVIDSKGPNPLRAGLKALGNFNMTEGIKDSSWKSYGTGIRHWLRFRVGVQRRHPCQIIPDSDPMAVELDAEDSLIEFVEWVSLAGTVAPTTAGDYVSAVKAAHLLWKGYPYESVAATRFFRLARVLSGLRKLRPYARWSCVRVCFILISS